jgi:ABC-type transport system involved in cytochrome bd biosynthesis fused ATPase/permease subunit
VPSGARPRRSWRPQALLLLLLLAVVLVAVVLLPLVAALLLVLRMVSSSSSSSRKSRSSSKARTRLRQHRKASLQGPARLRHPQALRRQHLGWRRQRPRQKMQTSRCRAP